MENKPKPAPIKSLLMLAFNFPPATNVGVHRTLRFAKYLGEFGCRPTILTRHCTPSVAGEQLLAQVPDDVAIHRVGSSNEPPEPEEGSAEPQDTVSTAHSNRYVTRSIKRRMKSLLRPGWELLTETPDQYVSWSRLAAAKGIELCRDGKFDAIYTSGPPHSTHLAGLKIQRASRLPWIADFRDPWARRPWVKARNPWGQRLLPHYERKVVHGAARVVLNNEASAEDFRRAYPHLPPKKFVSIPNGYDPDLLPLVAQLRQQRQQSLPETNGQNRIPVLCHPGTLYGQRDPRPILEAIASLHKEGIDVRFQQVGLVSAKFELNRTVCNLGIQHLVECIPPVSHAQSMAYMSRADVLLIIQPNAPLMVPGKLYEMLLFNLPIVAVCDSVATSSALKLAGNSWTVSSQDAKGIQTAIESALSDALDDETCKSRTEAKTYYNGKHLTMSLRDVFLTLTK